MHRSLPLLVSVLVVLAGCGIDEEVVAREAAEAGVSTPSTTTPPPAPPPPDTEPAAPFTVGAPPDGFALLVAGSGETGPGEERPVTVLAPDGDPVGPDVVLAEVVAEAEAGFVPDDEGRWASLTVEGDGPAVRVWGLDATEADLSPVADAVSPPVDARAAPYVAEPPAGLEVVGSITADGVQGLTAAVPSEADAPVPGPASAQVAVWVDGPSSLVVLALLAGTLDPAAVVTEARQPRRIIAQPRDAVAEEVAVGAEDGVVVTTAESESGSVVRRELAVTTAGGDVLLLISRGATILDADTLVAVAESVEPG